MSEQKLKVWKEKKQDTVMAKFWQELPKGQKYSPQCHFNISIAHSKTPMLMRCGQKVAGGQNYWESPVGMNKAVLTYLTENWDNIYPSVLEILEKEERHALKDCQSWVDEMQALISVVEEVV